MTKIDIISGFLGAGKTTLIKELLGDALKGEQVVLIENEFGEIGIDGGFLKEAGIEIKEMNSGCICCTLVGDFGEALAEVQKKYHPDRIIIEPSGVGKLSDVIHAVEKLPDVEINSATTVVDVTKCKMYLKNFGEFFENQVASCGTIILSRTDTERATAEKIEEAIALIRPINADATIITTPVAKLGGKKVLETMEGDTIDLSRVEPEHHHHHHHEDGECCHGEHHHHEDGECCHGEHHHHEDGECCHGEHHHHGDGECCHGEHHHHEDGECCHGEHHHHEDGECCHGEHHHHEDGECCHGEHHHHGDGECCHGEHHHHHDADEVFTSWGRETIRKYTEDEIRGILEELGKEEEFGVVLRAKGMVEGKDGEWIYFDMVPGEADVRSGAPEYTGRICVIGADIHEDRLEKLFGLK